MKRFFLSIALLLPFALLMSCSDDDDNYSNVEFGTLPNSVQLFVTEHFSADNIRRCLEYKCGYEVRLINRTEMRFNVAGEWMKVDMNNNVLPQSIALLVSSKILDYVSLHYPSYRIEEMEKKEVGGVITYIEVELNNDIEILFTLEGELITDRGPGAGSSETLAPVLGSLPQPAQDFINTHFAGVAITKIERDRVEYEVELANGVEIEFDIDGGFKGVEVEGAAGVPRAIIKSEILSYLTTNYPTRIVEEYSRLSAYYTGEYTGGYEVELMGKPEYKLYFSAAGTFLKVRL